MNRTQPKLPHRPEADNREPEQPAAVPDRKYDSAWKKVVRFLFENFLEFFFPNIYSLIDFSKEIRFLDKEFKEIAPDANLGDRVADVLVKVHLKDGATCYLCLIIHIEVQAQVDHSLMKRMFTYYYRAVDLESQETMPVISLVLLADDNPNYREGRYHFEFEGFEINMKVPVVKILDYKTRPHLRGKLETSKNPMSMIVRAQLKSHEVKDAGNARKYEVTKELIRECYRYGYSRETTRIILHFFDYVIRLPRQLKNRIKAYIMKTEEEQKMEYVPIWERDWELKLEQSEKRGIEIGEKRGEERGEKRGEKNGIAQEKYRVASVMYNDGVPLEIIVKYTGLPENDIMDLIRARQND